MMKSILIVLVLFLALTVSAQANVYYVYEMREGEGIYEFVRTNARTNQSEVIATISRTPDFSLASVMYEEEIAMAARFLALDSFSDVDSEEDAYEFFERSSFDGRIYDFSVSPDGEKLAIAVNYHRCVNRPRTECFGVSHVDVITLETGARETLWTIPEQAPSPYYPACDLGYEISELSAEVFIPDIRWTPDQTAVVAKIVYGRQYFDRPLVMIPVDSNYAPFLVGNGSHTWSIAPDSRTIVSLSASCSESEINLLNQFSFDLDGQVTHEVLALDLPIWMAGYSDTGVGYFQGNMIFAIETEAAGYVVGDTQRLAVVPMDEPLTQPTLLDLPFPGFYRITSSASQTVIQDMDGILWALESDFTVRQVTISAVAEWEFVADEVLAVRFVDETDFGLVPLLTE